MQKYSHFYINKLGTKNISKKVITPLQKALWTSLKLSDKGENCNVNVRFFALFTCFFPSYNFFNVNSMPCMSIKKFKAMYIATTEKKQLLHKRHCNCRRILLSDDAHERDNEIEIFQKEIMTSLTLNMICPFPYKSTVSAFTFQIRT